MNAAHRTAELVRAGHVEAKPHPLAALDRCAALRTCRSGQTIFGQNDGAGDWYRIIQGAARKSLLLSDGRRRIVDFYLPGDVLGFDMRNANHFLAEAISDPTVLAVYPRAHVEALADADPRVGRQIRDVAYEAVARAHARMLILGRVTSAEKVDAFLTELAGRLADRGTAVIVLPMSRYDIADYLALSVETVSRAMTHLQTIGAIARLGRRRLRILCRRDELH